MEGIFFLLSVIGVGVIMWWVIQNDRAGPTEPTHGLLAMDSNGASINQSQDAAGRSSLGIAGPLREPVTRPTSEIGRSNV